MSKEMLVILFQIILVFSMIAIITFIIMLNSTIKLEKRITKYSVKSGKNKIDKSFFDRIFGKYLLFVKNQRRKMAKLFPKLNRKYDKYVTDGSVKAIDYVTHKVVISFVFVIFMTVTLGVQGKIVAVYQIIFGLVLGFYILDIVLFLINLSKKKKVENEMLQAIIIMNNAFKSGKSTIQAVEIASNKLPKPINMEFKRIHQELKYGLSADVAFDRFSKRVGIAEAEYISSSLTILNKTGGNIVAVFNSIERTLFDKKKLKEELKNTTMASNLVVKVLLFIPIIVVLVIYILDSSYFDPFFDSPIGYILLLVSLLLFIFYAYFLEKIVRVDY